MAILGLWIDTYNADVLALSSCYYHRKPVIYVNAPAISVQVDLSIPRLDIGYPRSRDRPGPYNAVASALSSSALRKCHCTAFASVSHVLPHWLHVCTSTRT